MTKVSEKNEQQCTIVGVNRSSFTCKGCEHDLPLDYCVKTDDYCYLCDPAVTLEECLQDDKPDSWK
jgi:hypothetical protein